MTTRVAIDIAKDRITHIALRLQLDFSHLDRNLVLHCHLIIRVRNPEVSSRCRLLRAGEVADGTCFSTVEHCTGNFSY